MARDDLRVLHGGRGAPALGDSRLYDVEAEGAVLSNVMVDPAALDEVRALLEPGYFGSEAHRVVYQAAIDVADAGEPVTAVSVASRIRAVGRLNQAGGMAYLTEILNAAPAFGPSHLRAHARTVRELWARRELAMFAEKLHARCAGDAAGVDELLAHARDRVDELGGVVAASEQSGRADAVVQRAVAEIVEAAKGEGRGARPTGFDRLDRITAGLHEELVIIGARPGMGKTSLATGTGVNVASAGTGVYVASLETTETQLMTRIVCAYAGVEVHRARIGALTSSEWTRFGEASGAIASMPLWIDDEAGMAVATLWAKCRRVQLQLAREGKKLGLVVVDYVQLLRAPRSGMPREQVVGENARALKAMAQELGVTVLGLAQLNRDVDKRTDRRPQLSDLRESGELEQCARTVLLLYREDYYSARKPGYRPTGVVEVHVAKQNNGPTGLARLRFDAASTRFENLPEGEPQGARTPGPSTPCGGCGQRRDRVAGRCVACGWGPPDHGAEGGS